MAQTNTIQQAVSEYESRIGTAFKPTKARFYGVVGINQKRFGQLLRGEKEPVTSELKSLSSFFKVPVSQLINSSTNKKSPCTAPTAHGRKPV